MAAFNDFLKTVSENKELEEKFKVLLADEAIADKTAAIIEFSKECGAEVTKEDMQAYAEANKPVDGAELSDEQLDAVAGGGFWSEFAYGFCSVLDTLGFCFIR